MRALQRLTTLLAAVALGAAGLRAQDQTATAPPPPPDQAGPGAFPEYAGGYPNSWLEAEADAEYAFKLRTTGLNAELGAGVAPGQFVGFQYEYFNPWIGPGEGEYFDSLRSPYQEKETIDTYEFAYRFTFHLPQSPLSVYAGLSAGIGDVKLVQYQPVFAVSSQEHDRFAAGGVAGLQLALSRYINVKVGYRYIYLANVHLYGDHANIDTSALEAGLNFRF